MCGQAPENISHIISECSELAGDEYKVQYDKVGSTCIEHAAGGQRGILPQPQLSLPAR